MHPLAICKISQTNVLINPLKYVLHPTTSMCCQNLDAPTRNLQNITDKRADQPAKICYTLPHPCVAKIWMHPLAICKISQANMLINPLKYVLYPTTSMCCQNLDAPTRNLQNITNVLINPLKYVLHPTTSMCCHNLDAPTRNLQNIRQTCSSTR
jgi:hypothetical protein